MLLKSHALVKNVLFWKNQKISKSTNFQTFYNFEQKVWKGQIKKNVYQEQKGQIETSCGVKELLKRYYPWKPDWDSDWPALIKGLNSAYVLISTKGTIFSNIETGAKTILTDLP